jgi:hypothetical protein
MWRLFLSTLEILRRNGRGQRLGSDVAAAAAAYSDGVLARTRRLVQFQLFAMYFESHCGLVVMKDRLFRREDGRLTEVSLDAALALCAPR